MDAQVTAHAQPRPAAVPPAEVRSRRRPTSRAPSMANMEQSLLAPALALRFETADEVIATQEMPWLVPGVLPAGGFAALFGPSGSGKSFLALDLSLSLATGRMWFGRPVRQTTVMYLCLEGGAGFGKRVRAWREQHGNPPLPANLRFMRGDFQLQWREHRKQVAAVMQDRDPTNGGLIVIDTLSRAYGDADENSSSDMTKIVRACNQLQQETRAAVLVVHHTGKDVSKGLRGHSSLRAALDCAIEVRATRNGREWLVTKNKDGEEGELRAFKLISVALDISERGESASSCVVAPDGDHTQSSIRADRATGRNQRVAVDVLDRILAESIEFGQKGAPRRARCITLANAVAAVGSALQDVPPKRRNERARQAIDGLVSNGRYGASDGWLWQRSRG